MKHFAAHHGATGLYHETITVAYVLLIAERLATSRDLSWTAFSAAHPDLLARRPSILDRYYDEATLKSPQAREGFVMPVRVASRAVS
jgi:glutamine synthetase adenylyltransferase